MREEKLLAKASVLLAQVLIRLFALTAPLIGLVALLHPEILRRVLKVAGGVAFNLVVLSVLAGVHALLLQAIFDAGNSLNMLTQMVLAGLITVLLFMVGRPVRRLWQMVEMSVSIGRRRRAVARGQDLLPVPAQPDRPDPAGRVLAERARHR